MRQTLSSLIGYVLTISPALAQATPAATDADIPWMWITRVDAALTAGADARCHGDDFVVGSAVRSMLRRGLREGLIAQCFEVVPSLPELALPALSMRLLARGGRR